jgi:hypothetical protein
VIGTFGNEDSKHGALFIAIESRQFKICLEL